MTKYAQDYFDSTPGKLEQLVLACVTQEEINSYFLRTNNTGSILTDGTANSVTYGKQINDDGSCALGISIALSVAGISPLLDRVDLAARIESVNPLSTSDVGVARSAAFLSTSHPVNSLIPDYLTLDTVGNTLEKRIAWLVLDIHALLSWVREWRNARSVIVDVLASGGISQNELGNFVPDLTQFDLANEAYDVRTAKLCKLIVSTFKAQKMGLAIMTDPLLTTDEERIDTYITDLQSQLPHPKFRRTDSINGVTVQLYTATAVLGNGAIVSAASDEKFFDPANGDDGGSYTTGGWQSEFSSLFDGGGSGSEDSYQSNTSNQSGEPANSLDDC
jgi:hypothetical protein